MTSRGRGGIGNLSVARYAYKGGYRYRQEEVVKEVDDFPPELRPLAWVELRSDSSIYVRGSWSGDMEAAQTLVRLVPVRRNWKEKATRPGPELQVAVWWRGSLASSRWAQKGWPSIVVPCLGFLGRYELFEFFIDKKEESDAFVGIT